MSKVRTIKVNQLNNYKLVEADNLLKFGRHRQQSVFRTANKLSELLSINGNEEQYGVILDAIINEDYSIEKLVELLESEQKDE